MTKQVWFNLPTKDVAKAREFYTKMGFPTHSQPETGAYSFAIKIGDSSSVIMVFDESHFREYTRNGIANPTSGSEVLISIDAQSREEVVIMAQKAKDAGGTIFSEPTEIQGWMYGCGFTDLDGHCWNVLYMDMSKRK